MTPQPKRLRVYAALLAHETNTFSPMPTSLRCFEEGVLHRPGNALTQSRAHNFPGYGDLLRITGERGDTLIEGPAAWAQPAGPVPDPLYEQLRDELLEGLAQAGPVDCVALVLHGAMVAPGYEDCEGDLLQRVRALVGPQVAIGALLDLHANATPAMVNSGALLVACKQYPHTDYPERARELYELLAATARGECDPVSHLCPVPMLGLFGTLQEPMRSFVARLTALEGRDGVLSVSLLHGFAWSDTPYTRAAVLMICQRNAAARADIQLQQLAAAFFELCTQPLVARYRVEEALDRALTATKGPVVLADCSDNPGGGAACDSTFILQALLERQAEGVALGMLWDPQAVAIAADAGAGARLPLRIGGKIGPMSGQPLDLDVEVLAVCHDGMQQGLDGGYHEPLGSAVALRCGGIDIVLNSIRQQTFDPACFTNLGIDPASKRLVVVKSTQHFQALFAPLAAEVLYCDAPGSLNLNLAALPYRRLPRPIWPLDAFGNPSAPERPAWLTRNSGLAGD